MTRIGKTVRKRELPCTVSGNVNMHGHLGSNLSVYKCTIHVDLEILLLGIDLHRRKAVHLLKETCQRVLWLKLLVSYPFSILFLPTVYLVVVRNLLKTDISQTPLQDKEGQWNVSRNHWVGLEGKLSHPSPPFFFLLSGTWT